MATLLEFRNSSGLIGRCDAKCYNATKPECDCICRGMNHGKGIAEARLHTTNLAETWAEIWNDEHPDKQVTRSVLPKPRPPKYSPNHLPLIT